jgi:endonuclease YncB( thermonuclease family)
MENIKRLFWITLMIVGFGFPALNVYAQGKQKPGVVYDANITRVIDGDTVAFEAAFLPDPLKKELSIRVFGVDTPEKGHRAQCPSEAQRGEAASKFTKDMIAASQKRQIVLMDWDKYGGRVLGDVILNGQSLRAMLISKGFAREYYGEAKTSWCN